MIRFLTRGETICLGTYICSWTETKRVIPCAKLSMKAVMSTNSLLFEHGFSMRNWIYFMYERVIAYSIVEQNESYTSER